MLASLGADALKSLGYKAVPQTRAYVEQFQTDYGTLLPHKTVATRAGIGWIGKSALLVTKKFGSMVRITSILTDAPLKTAKPINKSKCGECRICTDVCPAGAISGIVGCKYFSGRIFQCSCLPTNSKRTIGEGI